MFETSVYPKLPAAFPRFLTRLAIDMFAIVQFWRPPSRLSGPERGRLFENVFLRYCQYRSLHVTEKTGDKTLNGQRAASQFLHENDCVIVTPDVLVQLELKHLTGRLGKDELLIFNQKGLDFLFANNGALRRLPLYRVILSGSPISEAARRFALQWGILSIEPGLIPLLALHSFACQDGAGMGVAEKAIEEIRQEVPRLIVSLQVRIRQLAGALEGDANIVMSSRVDRALVFLQKEIGGRCDREIERFKPGWLQARFEILSRKLRLNQI
jgi:hypothetical protein